MSLKTAFITTEREHLVDLSRRLVHAIAPERLQNPDDPVIVTVCGTLKSGKKIISDVAVEEMFGRSKRLKGKKGFDEYWFNRLRTCEIDFIDSAYEGGYSSSKLSPKAPNLSLQEVEKVSAFLKKRQRGGMTFIQNGELAGRLPSVEIWIERRDQYIVLPKITEHGFRTVEYNKSASRAEKSNLLLAEKFNSLSKQGNGWVRYVEVKINDKRLAQSPQMKEALGIQSWWKAMTSSRLPPSYLYPDVIAPHA